MGSTNAKQVQLLRNYIVRSIIGNLPSLCKRWMKGVTNAIESLVRCNLDSHQCLCIVQFVHCKFSISTDGLGHSNACVLRVLPSGLHTISFICEANESLPHRIECSRSRSIIEINLMGTPYFPIPIYKIFKSFRWFQRSPRVGEETAQFRAVCCNNDCTRKHPSHQSHIEDGPLPEV